MQHDIYSLGVCLLEIRLWQSFVVLNEEGRCVPSPALQLSFRPEELPALLVENDRLKDSLLCLARSDLPKVMGTKYTQIVETCLTCLDEETLDFGDESEFYDVDGIVVGVRFIGKVT